MHLGLLKEERSSEATDDLVGKDIAHKTMSTSSQRTSSKSTASTTNNKTNYISPGKRQQIIHELKL